MNQKKLLYLSMVLAVLLLLAGCGNSGTEPAAQNTPPETSEDTAQAPEIASAVEDAQDSGSPDSQDATASEVEDMTVTGTEMEETAEEEPAPEETANALVVYFSRIGEQYSVGVIEQGNTAIVADMIAEYTGADVFEITPAEDHYPTDNYRALTDIGLQEQKDNARPAIASEMENFEEYDTVFLGYPIWWNDLPMILYTFLESHDFTGKTVIPFCTHGGSQMAGTEAKIERTVAADAVLDGLAIAGTDAQNHRDRVRETVNNWLGGLGY